MAVCLHHCPFSFTGSIIRLTVPRSASKQAFYDARKSTWGDLFPHPAKGTEIVRDRGIKKLLRTNSVGLDLSGQSRSYCSSARSLVLSRRGYSSKAGNETEVIDSEAQSSKSAERAPGGLGRYPYQAGIRLPAAFEKNQSVQVPDETRVKLEKIVGHFRAVRWAVAYGSGVFSQEGYDAKGVSANLYDRLFSNSA